MAEKRLTTTLSVWPNNPAAFGLLAFLVAMAALSWAGLLSIPDFMAKGSYLALHAALEMLAVVVALLIFSTGFHAFNRQQHAGALIAACAFLGVGILDFLHTLSYPGMADFFTANTTHKGIVLWLAARLLAALGILALVLPALNRGPHRLARHRCLAVALFFTALFGYVGVFKPEWFPATFVYGEGLTTFKISLEWLITLLNLIALGFLLRYPERHSVEMRRFLAPALVILMASGFFFTSYQTASDSLNMLGHIYKATGYLLIYRAIFIENTKLPFQQLREAEVAKDKMHANLVEAQRIAQLGSWEWDINGGRIYWSDEVYRIFGVKPQTFGATYEAFLEYVHPRDREAVERAVSKSLAEPERPYSVEHRVVRKDESERWVHERGEVIRDEAGVPIRMVGSVLDITERKQAEARELQADKMGALGLMAGGIAHDFNNILTPIMMHTEMAIREVAPDSPLKHSLNQVRKAAERAAALVRQILDFSRQGQHEPMLVKMSMIVKEAAKFLQSVTPANVKLHYEINTINDSLAADPTQILQVVMNLSLNSIHAIGDNEGLLLISLDECGPPPNGAPGLLPVPEDVYRLPQLDQRGKIDYWLKLTVRDNGSGIRAKHLPRLFDPFFTTKKRGEGTGMGLPVVHGIVSRHGGRIRVESKPGEGTLFEVYLPALDGKAADQPEMTKKPLPRGNNEHILLVDDEAAILEAVASGLENLGYRLTTASAPIEALELLRAGKATDFDLMISDYSMPKLKGTELAAAAKVIRADLPVMLCTGYSSKVDESAAMAMGISALLMKPLRQELLAQEIRRVLDQKPLHLGSGLSGTV